MACKKLMLPFAWVKQVPSKEEHSYKKGEQYILSILKIEMPRLPYT